MPRPTLVIAALAYLGLALALSLRGDGIGQSWGALSSQWWDNELSNEDMDGEAARWDPQVHYPGINNYNQRESNFFDESISNGPQDAWQTHWPATGKNFKDQRSVMVAGDDRWRYTPTGWEPQFQRSDIVKEFNRADRHEAAWFDAKAEDYDVYGRRLPPELGTPQRMKAEVGGDQWYERSVNTTVRCADRNCTGAAHLRLFSPAIEEANHCFMNIHVHATDFDGDNSAENIHFWVNGFAVNTACEPMARGCNMSAWRPLYSCIRDARMDHLVDPTEGLIFIEGQISPMVDECPYQGNLLSAVAQATCMVRPKKNASALASSGALNVLKPINVSTQLRCRTPGCNASTILYIDPTIANHGGTCFLNLTVMETDFDDSSSEVMEYFRIDEYNESMDLLNIAPRRPSKNPCIMQYTSGTVPKPSDRMVRAIEDMNVTDEVRMTGKLTFRGKISQMVDECAYEDHLLNSVISVACCMSPPCTPPPLPPLPSPLPSPLWPPNISNVSNVSNASNVSISQTYPALATVTLPATVATTSTRPLSSISASTYLTTTLRASVITTSTSTITTTTSTAAMSATTSTSTITTTSSTTTSSSTSSLATDDSGDGGSSSDGDTASDDSTSDDSTSDDSTSDDSPSRDDSSTTTSTSTTTTSTMPPRHRKRRRSHGHHNSSLHHRHQHEKHHRMKTK